MTSEQIIGWAALARALWDRQAPWLDRKASVLWWLETVRLDPTVRVQR